MGLLSERRLELPVHNLSRSADGLRIGHISDLHLRDWNPLLQALQDRLCDHDFDMLLVTGDYGDRADDPERTALLLNRLLGPIRPSLGVYGVLGNHDAPDLLEHALPLTILRNETRLISVGSIEFYLNGIEQSTERRGTVPQTLDSLPEDVPTLLMAHYPSTVYEMPPGGGRILFAGHTHGGQIRVPGIGCLYTNDRLPRSLARGLHPVGGNWLHVSAGIGVSSFPRQRLFCPAEFSLLTLRSPRRRRRRHSSRGQKATVSKGKTVRI